mmetsp:Transcript_18797/g.31105  ORF Transcript_18797/g.31105 Transcript_18797/m.31105 type:complete len:223 (-) Transcript_18797:726-1394(-)
MNYIRCTLVPTIYAACVSFITRFPLRWWYLHSSSKLLSSEELASSSKLSSTKELALPSSLSLSPFASSLPLFVASIRVLDLFKQQTMIIVTQTVNPENIRVARRMTVSSVLIPPVSAEFVNAVVIRLNRAQCIRAPQKIAPRTEIYQSDASLVSLKSAKSPALSVELRADNPNLAGIHMNLPAQITKGSANFSRESMKFVMENLRTNVAISPLSIHNSYPDI